MSLKLELWLSLQLKINYIKNIVSFWILLNLDNTKLRIKYYIPN